MVRDGVLPEVLAELMPDGVFHTGNLESTDEAVARTIEETLKGTGWL